MVIYIAADHGGYEIKERLISTLSKEHEVIDCGNTELNPLDDASDFVDILAQNMAEKPGSLGIALCKSGAAMCIQANRYAHIRATVGHTIEQVAHDRKDDHINVLTLATKFTDYETILRLVSSFLSTPLGTDDRFIRRVKKLSVKGTHLATA